MSTSATQDRLSLGGMLTRQLSRAHVCLAHVMASGLMATISLLSPLNVRAEEFEVWQAAAQNRGATTNELNAAFEQLRASARAIDAKRAERTTALAAVARAENLVAAARAAETNQADVVERLRRALAELVAARNREIDELRRGRFCSKCSRAASRIERELGVSFSAHLSIVNGVPQPATQAMYDEVERRYRPLIRAAEARIASAEEALRARGRAVDVARQAVVVEEARVRALDSQIAVLNQRKGGYEDEVYRLFLVLRQHIYTEYIALDRYLATREAVQLVRAEEALARQRDTDSPDVRTLINKLVGAAQRSAETLNRARRTELDRFANQAVAELSAIVDEATSLGMYIVSTSLYWPSPSAPDLARARARRVEPHPLAVMLRRRRDTIELYKRMFRSHLEWQTQAGIWYAPAIVFGTDGLHVESTEAW